MEVANFLLDPNVAYLVLVITGVLLINAVLVPGTGVLEIVVIFLLVITGYQVYQLPFNWVALLFLLVGIVPFWFAVRKNERDAIPYMVVATVLFEVGSVFLYPSDRWWMPAVNPLLALVIVVVTSVYLWIITRAALRSFKEPPVQDLNKLIGKSAEARTDVHAAGTVYVAGELWSAVSDEPIAAGSMVKVIQRDGNILKVIPVDA
ncbi:MAG: NfeD family protein [Chloroflexota bacterium]